MQETGDYPGNINLIGKYIHNNKEKYGLFNTLVRSLDTNVWLYRTFFIDKWLKKNAKTLMINWSLFSLICD